MPINSINVGFICEMLDYLYEYRNIQLNWLIGPRILISGFPLPADVNRALCGGGVPEGRTHTVPIIGYNAHIRLITRAFYF